MNTRFLIPLALLGGCATYQSATLPQGDDLVREARQLHVDAASMPDSTLAGHPFDPSDGLDITEVAMLAVANSPELRSARADLGVTRAQAFSAGLLPDPQLALTRESVMGSPAGATVAFSAGLTADIGALLARSSAKRAADAESRKANLDLLWQEWQTVAKARLLFVKLDAITRSQAVLSSQREALRVRLDEARSAAERGLITNDAATPQLTAYEDVNRQWNDQERQRNQARHDLNALLGVAPEVPLVLVGSPDVATMTDDDVRRAIAEAPRRRPDLLALQAGFSAQDDRYRGAIRAQFPAITFGPTRARDTSDVNTVGFSLGISLPLFNRNRGNIAIESATRDKLLGEYQQRLDSTVVESHRLVQEQAILRRQVAEMDASLPALELAARRARDAFQAHNVDALTLTNIEGALLARRIERIAGEQALMEQAIGLQALLGSTFDLSQHAARAAGANLSEQKP